MDGRLMLLCVVLVPCIGAFVLPLLGRISAGLRNLVALGLAVVPLILVIAILPAVVSDGPVKVSTNFDNNFNFILYADGLAVFMAIVSALISSIIIFYSFGYISHYENQNEYYLMVLLFLGGMLGLIFSENLIFLYLFWEITAITSWRLIGFFREKQHVIRADKAFLVTMFGSLLMLIAFISIYQQTGSFDLQVIKEKLGTSHLSNLAVGLILVGILSKSATLPFHTWLPDAGVAPSPVTALLHAALLVKIGVYVFARLFIATFTVDEFWHTVVPIVAGASALVSAGAAMIDTDLKRIIAYSTVSQIGFIFLGLSIGNEIGVVGALLYILMHGLAKGRTVPLRRHRRAEHKNEKYNAAWRPDKNNADYRNRVSVLRIFRNGHTAVRGIFQQIYGDDEHDSGGRLVDYVCVPVRRVYDNRISFQGFQSGLFGRSEDPAGQGRFARDGD